MELGGWAQFGGTSSFGGLQSWAQRYYEHCKTELFPGYWPQDDSAVANQILRTLCEIVGYGKSINYDYHHQMFPQNASTATIQELESVLQVVPKPNQTLAERVLAVSSRWRGAQPSTLAAIRESLVGVLNPEYFWRDTHNDESIHSEYHCEDGNGGFDEAAGALMFWCSSTLLSEWNGSYLHTKIRCPDKDDDVSIMIHVQDTVIEEGSRSGIYLGNAHEHLTEQDRAVLFGAEQSGITTYLVLRTANGSVLSSSLGSIAEPSKPYWIKLSRSGPHLIASYGSDLDNLTVLATIDDNVIDVRRMGHFACNDIAGRQAYLEITDTLIQLGDQKNNVTILEVETAYDTTDTEDEQSSIYQISIQRWSEDNGTYNLDEARRICDRILQAHTVGCVGNTAHLAYDIAGGYDAGSYSV